MSQLWAVGSAGLSLPVYGPDSLPSWWGRIAPHVPGAERYLRKSPGLPPAVTLPENVNVSDARRMISAGLHVEHLVRHTLSVHGVALVRAGRAILLLGGHGAGKSLTGLALITAHGWRPAAGDVCLIRAAEDKFTVAGGTHSYVVRRPETSRWFPDLALRAQPECMDLADMLEPWYWPPVEGEVPLMAVVSVSVGDRISAEPASRQRQPREVSVSALYRASSYLVDKVLDDPDADPLRTAEDAERCGLRMRLARRAALRTPSWWSGGNPHDIATEISRAVAGDEAGCQ